MTLLPERFTIRGLLYYYIIIIYNRISCTLKMSSPRGGEIEKKKKKNVLADVITRFYRRRTYIPIILCLYTSRIIRLWTREVLFFFFFFFYCLFLLDYSARVVSGLGKNLLENIIILIIIMIICPIYNFEEYNTYGPAKRHILLYKTRNFPLHVDLKKKKKTSCRCRRARRTA